MSMSIYEMNYYNDSLQSKQNVTKSMAEKTKEEDVKQTELQKNGGLAQLTQGTEAYLQVKTGQANSQLSEETSDESLYKGAVRKDTLIISEEGRLASAQMRQQGEGVDTSSDSSSTVQPLQEESSGETGYQAEDLSEYTDAELKQMYYRGEITLQEYEDETGEVIE